jgi:stage V sporulation protein S
MEATTHSDLQETVLSVEMIKVSANSRSTAVAGAIAGVIREHGRAEVQSIGAGAVNQAIKAVAIARGYLKEDGFDIVTIPYFNDIEIDGNERTALRLIVEPRYKQRLAHTPAVLLMSPVFARTAAPAL